MDEIESYDKVSKFEPSDKGLFLWRDGKVFFDGRIIYDKKPSAVYFYEGVFFVVKNNWKDSVFIDPALRFSNNLKGIDGMTCFIDKRSILRNVWNEDYTLSKRQKIDLESGTVVWETEIGQPYISRECFFGVVESKLCRVNPSTGLPLWHLDLSEKYGSYSINGEDIPIDIQDYIGVYNDCLYVKAGNKLILGINTISGMEAFFYEYNGENVLLDNLRLDSSKGVIFSIGSTEYFELNLSSNESEVVPVRVNGLEMTRLGSWEDNLIYFWEGGRSSNFGIFDRGIKEIKITQNLNVSGYPAIKDIKHGHEKVYVLDGNNRLHIFGKSDNELSA